MTRTDEIVRYAVENGHLRSVDEIATIHELTHASVAVSLEYLAKSGIVFQSKESERWWLTEGRAMIVRAA